MKKGHGAVVGGLFLFPHPPFFHFMKNINILLTLLIVGLLGLRLTAQAQTCAAPTNATVALTPTTATIGFTPAGGVSSYRVLYYAAADSLNASTLTVAGTPVGLSGLAPNTYYIVRVYGNCNGVTSAPLGIRFRTPAIPVACGAVTNVVVTGTSPTTATVSFTSGAGNTLFRISYQRLNDSIRQVMTYASPATLTRLIPGQTYYIQVTSLCGTGASTVYTNGSPLTFAFRGTLAAQTALGAGQLRAFPNPAHRTAILALPAVLGAAQAEIALLNMLGQTVRTQAIPLGAASETRAELDLAGVPPGLYTLRVRAGGQAANQRLVVE